MARTKVNTTGIQDGQVYPNDLSTGHPVWDASGNTTISGTNASTSKTTGALVVTGGVGISGVLNVGGDVTAYATSDQRLKDNIKPIHNPLNKVFSISGNTFNWNDKSEKEGTDVGVIAQEIMEVLPEAVIIRDNGYLAVRYEKIIPLLIEAIKEQQNIIINLQNRLELLEGK